ncbi:MAG: DUF2635 domain-containing protein [Planctomycetota bacterium]
MDRTFLRPVADRVIRDPETRVPLPPEGAFVEPSAGAKAYWLRRILHGDVEVIDAQAGTDSPKPARRAKAATKPDTDARIT